MDAELKPILLRGSFGKSASRDVFVGFAPAQVLHSLSFADVLNEDTGRGYQRRFNSHHSLDFRKYIQLENSSTIPLTFNLRPRTDGAWSIQKAEDQMHLVLAPNCGRILTQVDCQHRLGHLDD